MSHKVLEIGLEKVLSVHTGYGFLRLFSIVLSCSVENSLRQLILFVKI